MRFLRQNTAVIVTVGPFYDKTDGVTIETALTITNERITLTADTDDNSAPTNILDNVTGATSGTSNDLNYITGNDAGQMQLELSAANTNRVGRMFLSITDAANHVPVFHEFFVLPAAIYDWLTGVIVPLPANVTHLLGTAWLTPGTAGTPDVNTKLIGGSATPVTNIGVVFNTDFATNYDATNDKWQVLAKDHTGANLATASALDAVDNFVDTEVASLVTDVGTLLTRLGTPSNLGTGATVAANLVDIEGQTDDIGVAGIGLTAVPWNAAWDAEVQSEVDDALIAKGLDHLVFASVAGTDIADNSIIAKLVSKSATADWDSFVNTTDALEAIRDRGDAAWTTATGFSTLDAAGVRAAVGLASANLDTQLAAIVADTNELQVDWVDGGRLDLILDARASQVSVNTIDDLLDTEVAALQTTLNALFTTALTESYRSAGAAPTMAQFAFETLAHLGDSAIVSTTKTLNNLAGTAAKTFTLNSSTTPTSITEAT